MGDAIQYGQHVMRIVAPAALQGVAPLCLSLFNLNQYPGDFVRAEDVDRRDKAVAGVLGCQIVVHTATFCQGAVL